MKIPNVLKTVLVASGKGGVGKSTVSVNLALSLQSLGSKVGLLDADVFGPSVPKLMNLSGPPRISESGKLLPLVNYGMPTMSMGYLMKNASSAAVWRGQMVGKALRQLVFDVEWGNLDILIIDMPPGTGDTQLTISQHVDVSGAVIVSTPQDIALSDVKKGITMFSKVDIPIIGLVQNMSHFVCPNCSHESHIFGYNGVSKLCERDNLELLASIPLSEEVAAHSDDGMPIAVQCETPQLRKAYMELAEKVKKKLAMD